jgi:hypothetical protein
LKNKTAVGVLVISFGFLSREACAIESLYSGLSDQECKVVQEAKEGEGDWVTQECPGVLGYKLLKHTDDGRESLTLVQEGQEHPLNFWGHVTGSFNELGEKAEWRVRDGKVTALIVRMSFTDPENHNAEQRLIVAKVQPSGSCVTHVVNASKVSDANEEARIAANRAPEAQCLWK